jgi:UDP-N-acetylglucosamine diphosphorylase / glucose-1-phosphate thymidylyltransferase / UDP-N-acetylgalactosamine diphosphorylase / glucosamine-1-phosphate N-acetyltransferase / galactosamine-1-phosphate N-acetyltransferase
MLSASDFFNLSETEHAALFENTTYVWEAIKKIGAYIQQRLSSDLLPNREEFDFHPSVVFGDAPIFIGEGTKIHPAVYIEGPAIIGRNCEIRQGAYIRQNVVLGNGAVVGHTTELKNTVMLERAQAPHFAYLGDSLIGARVNLGAGTKLSNLTVNSKPNPVTHKRPTLKGLDKFGAVLGDDVQTGCNTVTNPGVIVGPRTLIYALASLSKGYYPPDKIVKVRPQFEITDLRS